MSRIILRGLSQKEISRHNDSRQHSNADCRRNIRIPVIGNPYRLIVIIIMAFAPHRLFLFPLRPAQFSFDFHAKKYFFIGYVIAIRTVNIVVIIRYLIPTMGTYFHDLSGTALQCQSLSPSHHIVDIIIPYLPYFFNRFPFRII